jgi:hypothetical protein
MCKKNLLKLFFGFSFLFLFVVFQPGFILASDITGYEIQSNPQTPENYNSGSEALQPNLNEQKMLSIDPNNPWSSLRNWINEGMQGLNESAESLTMLENQLAELQAENNEQELLLRQSQELLTSLKQNLAEAQNSVDIAIDRMQDAESYALFIDRQNELLKLDVQRFKKSALIGFSFGGVSFGVGSPLIIAGIQSDNKTMLWTGIGVIGFGSIVWATGHYLFNWW